MILTSGVESATFPFLIEPNASSRWVLHNGSLIQAPETTKLHCQTNGKELSLILQPGEMVEEPIYLIHLTEQSLHHKTQIVMEEGAKAQIIECYFQSRPASFSLQAETELLLKQGSTLNHIVWADAASSHQAAISIDIQIEQAEKSQYSSFFTGLGYEHYNTNLRLNLGGKQAQAEIAALFLPKQAETAKFHCLLQHLAPDCQSQLLTRSVLTDYAKFDFSGRIKVSEGARKSLARLENKNILLSANAEAHSRPELEIYHDDLQCSHGATLGYLDNEALFYLKSRGIPEQQAKQLLVQGFIQPILQTVPLPILQTHLEKSLDGHY